MKNINNKPFIKTITLDDFFDHTFSQSKIKADISIGTHKTNELKTEKPHIPKAQDFINFLQLNKVSQLKDVSQNVEQPHTDSKIIQDNHNQPISNSRPTSKNNTCNHVFINTKCNKTSMSCVKYCVKNESCDGNSTSLDIPESSIEKSFQNHSVFMSLNSDTHKCKVGNETKVPNSMVKNPKFGEKCVNHTTLNIISPQNGLSQFSSDNVDVPKNAPAVLFKYLTSKNIVSSFVQKQNNSSNFVDKIIDIRESLPTPLPLKELISITDNEEDFTTHSNNVSIKLSNYLPKTLFSDNFQDQNMPASYNVKEVSKEPCRNELSIFLSSIKVAKLPSKAQRNIFDNFVQEMNTAHSLVNESGLTNVSASISAKQPCSVSLSGSKELKIASNRSDNLSNILLTEVMAISSCKAKKMPAVSPTQLFQHSSKKKSDSIFVNPPTNSKTPNFPNSHEKLTESFDSSLWKKIISQTSTAYENKEKNLKTVVSEIPIVGDLQHQIQKESKDILQSQCVNSEFFNSQGYTSQSTFDKIINCNLSNEEQPTTVSDLLLDETVKTILSDNYQRYIKNKQRKMDNFCKNFTWKTAEKINRNHVKRYRKGTEKIFKLRGLRKVKTKVLSSHQLANQYFPDLLPTLTQEQNTQSSLESCLDTNTSYETDVTTSEVLSTGSRDLVSNQTLLRKAFNELSNDKSLLYNEEELGTFHNYSRSEIKTKIRDILYNVYEDLQNDGKCLIQYRRQTIDNCIFQDYRSVNINGSSTELSIIFFRLKFKPYKQTMKASINSVHPRGRLNFKLFVIILNKILSLLEKNMKITKR